MKIVVLGAGSIGSRHIKNLIELGHKVAVYDPMLWAAMTRDSQVEWADAVVIATPTNQHFDDIQFCNKAGKPMFVEKPIVSTYSEWVNAPLEHIKMVGYNLRFHSCVKKAKELLGKGVIGKPLWSRFICAQHNERPAYMRDGVILNWSHEIDLAIHLIGNATYMAGSSFRPSGADHWVGEDVADLILYHDRTKCQTTIHLDYLTKPQRRGFMIVGETGAIEADLVTRVLFLKDENGKVVEVFTGRDSWDGNYLDEMRKFIDRLEGKEVIGCTAAEALLVAHICLRARENIHAR